MDRDFRACSARMPGSQRERGNKDSGHRIQCLL